MTLLISNIIQNLFSSYELLTEVLYRIITIGLFTLLRCVKFLTTWIVL